MDACKSNSVVRELQEYLRDIPRWPNYAADRAGNIWGLYRREMVRLAQATTPAGHRTVSLRRDGKLYGRVGVGRLVLLAFVGPPPFPGAICLHGDHGPGCNAADNVRWGSRADQAADMIRRGVASCLRRGKDHPSAGHPSPRKIPPAIRVAVAAGLLAGIPPRVLTRRYGVSYPTVRAIRIEVAPGLRFKGGRPRK